MTVLKNASTTSGTIGILLITAWDNKIKSHLEQLRAVLVYDGCEIRSVSADPDEMV